ncbi:hypothetical protein [Pseudogemmobacter faecipullorum]|uniref:Uncharacterized protein n=1 Tax=Pseudogemmobacter faecipullorum TaxID=2755041 RepID=A0ABS8CQX0_9RHOB|nr:hypothetical protein [Pseudogemmobacter faecipullorum]MCB5411768.1 hypothetical protein [Pseudogemmobacter faecipullorum]
MIRITIACPVAHLADASQFARATGYGPADEQTFHDGALMQGGDGALYRVASGMVADGYAEAALAPLHEPEWGADMEAATRAQALVAVWQPTELEAEPYAMPDRIAVVIGGDVTAALVVLGVSLPA